MNKPTKYAILGLIVALLAWLAYDALLPHENSDMKQSAPSAKETSGQKGKRGQQILEVRAVVVRPQELSDELTLSGSLVPDEEVSLSFETSGKVTDIFFREGSMVEKGQLLAKINDAPLQAQLRRKEAQLRLMQDRVFRARALLEKEAVSKEAFQEAEANLSALRAEIEGVKAEIAQTCLIAPFSGVIGLRQVSVGAFATTQTAVAMLTKRSPLKVEFSVPERYAGSLPNGAELAFTVEGDLTARYARVYASDSRVDDVTRTFTVRALYDNPQGKLVPGRYVNVRLRTRQFHNALAVPSEAIVSEMGLDKVYVLRDGIATPQNIHKGLRTDALVQVLSGLHVGDTVITSGTMQLRAGQPVKAIVKEIAPEANSTVEEEESTLDEATMEIPAESARG